MAWSVDTTVLELPALVAPRQESTFSPPSYGGQSALQPQQQLLPQQLLQQYHMSDTHHQGGYAKPQLDVPYNTDFSLLSPGGESGYGSACSVGQASPMSRNVGGSPAPPRPSSRATPALDPEMEESFLISATNTLNNFGPTAYTTYDSYNTITNTLNESFDNTHERPIDNSFGSPMAAGYSPPFVDNPCDFPFSPQTSNIAYEPQQPQHSHSQPQPQHQQHLQEEEKQQFRVPPGEF